MVLAVALLTASCSGSPGDGAGDSVPAERGRVEAQQFLDALTRSDAPAAAALTTGDAATVAVEIPLVMRGLRLRGGNATVRTVTPVPAGAPFVDLTPPLIAPTTVGTAVVATVPAPPVVPPGDRLRATFDAALEVGGLGQWTFTGELAMVVTSGGPRVVWTAGAVHPALGPGQRLERSRTMPDRASILGAGDQVIVGPRSAVSVGVVPGKVRDLDSLVASLAAVLPVDPARVRADVNREGVKPDWFIPVITISRDAYAKVKPAIYDLPGTTFKENESRLPPTPAFARHALGRTAEITAEQLTAMGTAYQTGDVVGQTGIEQAYERQLAGSPSGEIRVVGPGGDTVTVVHQFAGISPETVKTTLDLALQTAAETALEGAPAPASLVAVNATGEVVAAVSRPLSDDFNRAFLGSYPPGSTFKIVTAAALLDSGRTPASPLGCPATLDIGGRIFRNFEGEAESSLDLARAFAISCNTAFLGAAQELPTDGVGISAARFGFGADYNVGLAVKGGAFPDPADDAERAAASIGQGRVTVSPLHMASVGGAIAGGGWRPPLLVRSSPKAVSAPGPAIPAPLSASTLTGLQSMLRAAVVSGTGMAANSSGRPVGGKTGTAEFGPGPDPQTHAWFVGVDGNLGVAVMVEGGGVGGEVAAPLAGRFFASRRP